MTWIDATEMTNAVKAKEISAEELVQQAMNRIERLNPTINAVTNKQYEQALTEAKQLTHLSNKPFAGVPFLLKDLGQNEEGQISSAGSRLFQQMKAKTTDYYVKRLKDLGFIIVGRTNTPEFGFKNISDAELHGAVNLPQDLKRNAGGSSGGAAAAISSGMVTIAAASDGGGSIRIPASFNGLIGLKTTRGRIPVGPDNYRGWQGASVNFALTKSVRDTKRLLYHLQTYQVDSPFPLKKLSHSSLFESVHKPLNIAYITKSPVNTPVSPQAKEGTVALCKALAEIGHHITELTDYPFDGIELMQSYYLMNSVETAAMFASIEKHLGRFLTLNDMELMTWAIYQSGQTILAKDYTRIIQQWDYYSEQMANFHQQYDLLITPTVANVAPYHDQFTLTESMKNRLVNIDQLNGQNQQQLIWDMFEPSLAWTPFTQFANITGQPAISLPTYQQKDGLPIGVQFCAPKGREDRLLQVASDLESRGHFVKQVS